MKVFEYSLFHNEDAALHLKRGEAARWVDELHLCEAAKTFRGGDRRPILPTGDGFLVSHLLDGARFHPPQAWGVSRQWPFFRKKDMARKNETIQRDYVHEILEPEDGDIVILSDIDEIIDSRHADEIIDAALKHGIISIEMRHTFFYLNLYSTNFHEVWKGSPPNYAYRTFVMTGRHFRNLGSKSDRLRRLGEWNRLAGQVHLMDGFRGFHHSWLGDEDAALEKMQSYSHSLDEHAGELASEDGTISKDALRSMIRSGRSVYEGNTLEARSFADIEPLRTVTDNVEKYREFILDA